MKYEYQIKPCRDLGLNGRRGIEWCDPFDAEFFGVYRQPAGADQWEWIGDFDTYPEACHFVGACRALLPIRNL